MLIWVKKSTLYHGIATIWLSTTVSNQRFKTNHVCSLESDKEYQKMSNSIETEESHRYDRHLNNRHKKASLLTEFAPPHNFLVSGQSC